MPDSEPFVITFRQEGKTLVGAIPADILVQTQNVEQLCDQIDRAIDAAPPGASLLLTFGQVRYMSSIFLGKLIAFQKKLARQNGKLLLSDLNNDLADVMRHAKLDKLIAIYPNAAAALAGGTLGWAAAVGRKLRGH